MPEIIRDHLLTCLVFLPLIGAVVLMFMPKPAESPADGHGTHQDSSSPADPRAQAIRWMALLFSLLTFALSLILLFRFHSAKSSYQFVDGPYNWIKQFHVHYYLGIDGISLLLILLTTFLSVLCIGYSFSVKQRVKEFMIFMLVLETGMLGVFCALDLVLFYVFWESMLIPMYFLIGIWGHERRIYAAIKFFIFTFIGSVLMLVAIVALYVKTGSFNLVTLLTPGTQPHHLLSLISPHVLMWMFAAFALAFMIKVPMFPFHTWLPDAHVEAPTAGSVILAGVLLKMGIYGFLRFCLPLFPAQAHQAAPLFLTLAVIGIVYGAIVAAMQPDMKKVVAYSSVSHLGFVMLGIFSLNPLGITGAVLQSINHGVSTGALFFIVGMFYDRKHTRLISAYGGVKRAVPILAAFFLIAMLSSIALPLTNGFVGEFTILQGSFISHTAGWKYTAVATTGMILSAVYMLWMFQRVMYGPLDKEDNRSLPDLVWREKLVLAPLVVLIFWFGCYVTTWTKPLIPTVDSLVSNVGPASIAERRASAASILEGTAGKFAIIPLTRGKLGGK